MNVALRSLPHTVSNILIRSPIFFWFCLVFSLSTIVDSTTDISTSPCRAMTSIDSKADFNTLLDDLGVHQHLITWMQGQGFATISDVAFTFVASNDGAALVDLVPVEVWRNIGVPDPANPSTTVHAGKLRRLLAQCRMVVQQLSASESATVSTTAAPVAPASWQELAPPRLTPEAVQQLIEAFQKNYPGELLTSDSTPSIRLLSVVHHCLKPGQSLRYIPWQIRMSQKQYQEMTEAKTHKAIRSEAQLLGALLDETPELAMENVRLSADWLSKTQQVFRNAFVLCHAAHLQIFKKFDDKFFSLAMKRHPSESNLRSVNLSELLEADKVIWGEIIAMRNNKWSLDEALHELTACRADLYGLLQPRPRFEKPIKPPKPDKQLKDLNKVKKLPDKNATRATSQADLCSYMVVEGAKKPLCQRYQRGNCTSKTCKYLHKCAVKVQGKPCGKAHGAHQHSNKT